MDENLCVIIVVHNICSSPNGSTFVLTLFYMIRFLGDGAVMDLHPTFTYRTCPTPAEISFVLAALVSVGSISLLDLMMAVGSIGIADCGMDVIHHCINEPGVTAPSFKGLARVYAAMEGTLCRNVNEIGRLWGHLVCRR